MSPLHRHEDSARGRGGGGGVVEKTHGCVAVFRVVMKDKHCSGVTERRPWTWPSARSRGRRSPMMQWQLLEIAAESALARCKGLFIAGFWWKKNNINHFFRHIKAAIWLNSRRLPLFSCTSFTALGGSPSFSVLLSPCRFSCRVRVSQECV